MVHLYQSSEIPVTLNGGRNALLMSDTLLKLTLLSLHSTILLDTPGGLQRLKYIVLMEIVALRMEVEERIEEGQS